MHPASGHTSAVHTSAAVEAAAWQVRVLGRFEIDDGQQRLTRLRSRAAMALLARLAMRPGRDHAREELAALLWPEADGETGRARLRQTLSLLKAVLETAGGEPVLVADRRVVRAAPGALWCDAVAFESALRRQDSAEARRLYGGELLPGFYDEWITDERLRLQALADALAATAAVPAATVAVSLPMPTPAAAAATTVLTATTTAPTSVPAGCGPGTRLPHYLTRLIGADQQGARLQALVAEHRLVTVLGQGGAGKTRLAVEVARLALEAPPGPGPCFDHAVFVSLVDARTRGQLLDRLQLALRVAGGDALQAVQATLAGRRRLLVLDNAETLDAEAAATVAALAEHAPKAHWLVTSRRPLELDGERSFTLEPLALPTPDAALTDLVMNPAVALLVDRARAHRPDFHVHAGNQEAVADLVRWLGGLPLAVELAASHSRTLRPAELLQLLKDSRQRPGAGSLAFLARRGPRSGSDGRHASMLAVVAASWQLLTPPQRQLLSALSLRAAPATSACAQALSEPPAGPAGTQALLDALVAQSVLRLTQGQDGQTRFAPEEPVREYALAQIHPDGAQALRTRHLDWLLAWADAMPPTPSLPEVRDEMPAILQALETAVQDGSAALGVQLVLKLQSSWGEMAIPASLLQALDRLLANPGLDDSLAAAAHAFAATCHLDAGNANAARLHLAAAAARPCPDPVLRSMVWSRSARLHWRLDRDAERARALIAQALPLARAHDRPNTEASLLSLQGHLATVVDKDPVRGAELSAQSLALWLRSGNLHLVHNGRFNVATNRMLAGEAEAVMEEFVTLEREARALQDWDLASGALESRGTGLMKLRRWAEAWACHRESVRVAWDGLEVTALVYALWNAAPALARQGQGELAACTMGAAEALWRTRFGRLDASDERDLKRVRRFAAVLVGRAAAQAAWRRGAAMPLGDLVRRLCEVAAAPPVRGAVERG